MCYKLLFNHHMLFFMEIDLYVNLIISRNMSKDIHTKSLDVFVRNFYKYSSFSLMNL